MRIDAVIFHYCDNTVNLGHIVKCRQDKLGAEIYFALSGRLVLRVSLGTVLWNEAIIGDLKAACGDTLNKVFYVG